MFASKGSPSRLPVDVASLEGRVRSAAERAGEIGEVRGESVSDAERTRISGSLDEVAETLVGIDSVVDDISDSLRFWIRLAGLLFLLLSLWGLWAQVALANQGRRSWKNSSGSDAGSGPRSE